MPQYVSMYTKCSSFAYCLSFFLPCLNPPVDPCRASMASRALRALHLLPCPLLVCRPLRVNEAGGGKVAMVDGSVLMSSMWV